MKIGIFSKNLEAFQEEKLLSVINFLQKENVEIALNTRHKNPETINKIRTFSTASELNEFKADFLFTIGGDGTLLDSVCLIKESNIPILGINTGRLGFLANNQMEDLPIILNMLRNKEFNIEKRTLIQLDCQPDLFGTDNFALNEFTIHKGDSSSLVTITVFLNNEIFNTYWCDGLILSTPTGSTAYSLSCGGPIVFPHSNTLILTPVAPHNLNVRPVIFPDDMEFSFKISGRNRKFLISLDSRCKTIDENVKLKVTKAPFNIFTVKFNNQKFSKILREKLNWGLDQRNAD